MIKNKIKMLLAYLLTTTTLGSPLALAQTPKVSNKGIVNPSRKVIETPMVPAIGGAGIVLTVFLLLLSQKDNEKDVVINNNNLNNPPAPIVIPRNTEENSVKAPFVGITNLGVTCYMNTLLQSLHSIPEIREGAIEPSERKFVLINDLMKAISNGNISNPENQLKIKELVDIVWPNAFYQQQDARESLQIIKIPENILNVYSLSLSFDDKTIEDILKDHLNNENSGAITISIERNQANTNMEIDFPETVTVGEDKLELVCIGMRNGTFGINNGGHYYAYRKHDDGSWWQCSDLIVTLKSTNNSLLNDSNTKNNAAFLTYKKVKN